MFDTPLHNYRDLYSLVRNGASFVWQDIRYAMWKMALASVVCLVAAYILDASSAVLWFIFVVFFLYRWDERILGSVAILFLVSCPILISVDMQPLAETMAVFSFLFLVMFVVLQILSLQQDTKNKVIAVSQSDHKVETKKDSFVIGSRFKVTHFVFNEDSITYEMSPKERYEIRHAERIRQRTARSKKWYHFL